jgi:nucleolar protein 4
MREDSLKQRQTLIKNNPTLHLSLTRLSVRNLPRHVTSKDLKALAREAVVGFAKDVKAGLRQPLSKEELNRSTDTMKEAEKERKLKGKGIVKQAKIVFEGRDGSKIEEKSGAGRSRGYGFIEYATHRNALMGLRWLNGHGIDGKIENGIQEKKKRLIVEFAIENAQVVKRRSEHQAQAQAKARTFSKTGKKDDESHSDKKRGQKAFPGTPKRGMKRKRSESTNNEKKPGDKEKSGDSGEKDNRVAKRNRIIAKKRMQRKARKGKA